jgi:ATP-dependent helicase HrpA
MGLPTNGSAWRTRSNARSNGAEGAPRASRRLQYPEDCRSRRAPTRSRGDRAHPVVIVCGETGSGKTTQLPKICLAAGRGERG